MKRQRFWESDYRLFSFIQKETVWQSKFFVKMAGTLFSSTIDTLLIQLLSPFSCLNIVSHKTEYLNYYKCFIITLWTNLSDSTIYIDLLSPSSVRRTHLCQAIIRNARQYIEDAGVGVLCQHQAGGRLHGGRLWGAGGGLPVIGRESQCIGFN